MTCTAIKIHAHEKAVNWSPEWTQNASGVREPPAGRSLARIAGLTVNCGSQLISEIPYSIHTNDKSDEICNHHHENV